MNPLVYDLSLDDLKQLLAAWGEPQYRASQIWSGLYQKLWDQPDQFSNLSNALRQKMAAELRFSAFTPGKVLQSSDRETTKTLLILPDQLAVEAVLMRYEERRTLCISTQAGCAMGCVFCATGQMGFKRNLTSGEIVAQVLYNARILQAENDRVTNVVIMGMGEPFNNYENTLAAVDRLNDANGFKFGERRITISTVGLIPMIRRFAQEKRQVGLAISLHAANDELRSSLLPVNRKYSIADLISACRDYVDMTGRRITFEYALIHEVNDTAAHARELAGLLRGMICHVNVIPLNPTNKYSGQATSRKQAEDFKSILENAGIPCTIRIRRGIDIQAGCGQLATNAETA